MNQQFNPKITHFTLSLKRDHYTRFMYIIYQTHLQTSISKDTAQQVQLKEKAAKFMHQKTKEPITVLED